MLIKSPNYLPNLIEAQFKVKMTAPHFHNQGSTRAGNFLSLSLSKVSVSPYSISLYFHCWFWVVLTQVNCETRYILNFAIACLGYYIHQPYRYFQYSVDPRIIWQITYHCCQIERQNQVNKIFNKCANQVQGCEIFRSYLPDS